jgi:hypothetical protein
MTAHARYAIFVKRFAALGTDDPHRDYLAVPVDHLYNGIFIPASHYEVDPTILAEIDADSKEDAVARYRESLEDAFL